MSQRDDSVPLRHMQDHALEAIELATSAGRDELERSRLLQLALTRLIEVVGEAAVRVSTATREAHPEIPWRQAITMRNRLIHGYDVLDLDILWQTVTDDLPTLVKLLDPIVSSDSDTPP